MSSSVRANAARALHAVRYHGFPLAGIDAMTAATARSFPRHTHDQYGLGVIDSGGHRSWSGRGHVEARKGEFISVNPGEMHDGHAMEGRVRSWRILYFAPEVVSEWHEDVSGGSGRSLTFASPVFEGGALRASFEAAFAFAGSALGHADTGVAPETAMLRLLAALGKHATAPATDRTRGLGNIHAARERIDTDPAAHVTLAELARECGLSRYQLLRAFARRLGCTPHAYILQRRLALARTLLRAGRPLAAVAADAGFYDQSHLTRCFARQFGVTPGRYAGRD